MQLLPHPRHSPVALWPRWSPHTVQCLRCPLGQGQAGDSGDKHRDRYADLTTALNGVPVKLPIRRHPYRCAALKAQEPHGCGGLLNSQEHRSEDLFAAAVRRKQCRKPF
mmetsp:Transcript_9288/g.27907  ORF Transcript_9288/g.27907 Transcript_9288/m.27907 type:complete len:109 (-) Transcript_9288:531-857(-)